MRSLEWVRERMEEQDKATKKALEKAKEARDEFYKNKRK